LIRLDSAKEIQGFYLDFVALDLDFVVPGFDFLALGLEIRRGLIQGSSGKGSGEPTIGT
jgi:hypothetical protein